MNRFEAVRFLKNGTVPVPLNRPVLIAMRVNHVSRSVSHFRGSHSGGRENPVSVYIFFDKLSREISY
jgi:hypothetical protein